MALGLGSERMRCEVATCEVQLVQARALVREA